MSWSIYSIGNKQNVRRQVENATAYGDPSQMELAKQLIFAEIDALPESMTGVEVRAGGHHDERSRSLSIEIKPVLLAPDPEEPQSAQ